MSPGRPECIEHNGLGPSRSTKSPRRASPYPSTHRPRSTLEPELDHESYWRRREIPTPSQPPEPAFDHEAYWRRRGEPSQVPDSSTLISTRCTPEPDFDHEAYWRRCDKLGAGRTTAGTSDIPNESNPEVAVSEQRNSEEETTTGDTVMERDQNKEKGKEKVVAFNSDDRGIDAMSSGASHSPANEPESDTDADSGSGKIPKPPGEAGRPNSGGYCLRKKLDWPTEKYDQVYKQAYLKRKVPQKLNCGLPFSEQTGDVENLKRESLKKFPWLDEYRDLWPVTDIIKSRLKYQKDKLEKKKKEELVARARAQLEEAESADEATMKLKKAVRKRTRVSPRKR